MKYWVVVVQFANFSLHFTIGAMNPNKSKIHVIKSICWMNECVHANDVFFLRSRAYALSTFMFMSTVWIHLLDLIYDKFLFSTFLYWKTIYSKLFAYDTIWKRKKTIHSHLQSHPHRHTQTVPIWWNYNRNFDNICTHLLNAVHTSMQRVCTRAKWKLTPDFYPIAKFVLMIWEHCSSLTQYIRVIRRRRRRKNKFKDLCSRWPIFIFFQTQIFVLCIERGPIWQSVIISWQWLSNT